MPHISIKAEPIFEIFGFNVTNSMIASVIVTLLSILFAVYYYKQSISAKKSSAFYLINYFFKSVYDMFKPVLGENAEDLYPLVGALFIYILFQNWFGLLPGVGSILIKVTEGHEKIFVPLLRGNNADLNTTVALAIIAVLSIQIYGIKYLGFLKYIKKFVNISNPINFFLGILELISEFSRVFSFAFRLFGNIFAGEVLIAIIAFLVPVLASFPFLLLEIFVGLIQALIFSMLTAVLLGVAVSENH